MQALRADGCNVMDLTGNELAKAHARHLVGGRSPNAADELLYRFEFPERRGGTLNRPGLPAARVQPPARRPPEAQPPAQGRSLCAREEIPHRLAAGEAVAALSGPPYSDPTGVGHHLII